MTGFNDTVKRCINNRGYGSKSTKLPTAFEHLTTSLTYSKYIHFHCGHACVPTLCLTPSLLVVGIKQGPKEYQHAEFGFCSINNVTSDNKGGSILSVSSIIEKPLDQFQWHFHQTSVVAQTTIRDFGGQRSKTCFLAFAPERIDTERSNSSHFVSNPRVHRSAQTSWHCTSCVTHQAASACSFLHQMTLS